MVGVDVELVATYVDIVYFVCQFAARLLLSPIFFAVNPFALLGHLEVVVELVINGGLDP